MRNKSYLIFNLLSSFVKTLNSVVNDNDTNVMLINACQATNFSKSSKVKIKTIIYIN